MGQFGADVINGADAGGGNKGLVEREAGLPAGADLPLLYQLLIPQGLASAFRISPQQSPTVADVDRASVTTFYSIQSGGVLHAPPHPERKAERARKKQRISWTPELQRRFLDVVRRLGVNNAVPKAIMQMMNVEGLSRVNVASHLQKYRLYLKRRQGFTGGDATSSSSGNGGGFPQVGPPTWFLGMNHRHHRTDYNNLNDGRDPNHHHGHDVATGLMSNLYIAEQNDSGGGPNDMEEEFQRL